MTKIGRSNLLIGNMLSFLFDVTETTFEEGGKRCIIDGDVDLEQDDNGKNILRTKRTSSTLEPHNQIWNNSDRGM